MFQKREVQSKQNPDKLPICCQIEQREPLNHSLLQAPLLDQAHLDTTATPEDNLKVEHGMTPMLQAICSLEMNANQVWKNPSLIFPRKNLESHVFHHNPLNTSFYIVKHTPVLSVPAWRTTFLKHIPCFSKGLTALFFRTLSLP